MTFFDKYPDCEVFFNRIRAYHDRLVKCRQKGDDIFHKQSHEYQYLLFLTALKRTRDNIDGFLRLVEDFNFSFAAVSIQLQLDTLQRILFIMNLGSSTERRDVCAAILENTALEEIEITDKMGNRHSVSEELICKSADAIYTHSSNVTKLMLRFIHLSSCHLTGSINGIQPTGNIGNISIDAGYKNVSYKEAFRIFVIFDSLLKFTCCTLEKWPESMLR